jgi:hypothetical protein
VPRKPKTAKSTADKAPPAQSSNETEGPPPHTLHPNKPATAAPKASDDKDGADKPRQDNGGAEIVSLDAFRKK